MGLTITKTFSVAVVFSVESQNSLENLSASDINYLSLKTMIKKRIAQQVECSQGVISSHIVGEVSEA